MPGIPTREHIVLLLSRTRYAREDMNEEEVVENANKLGVLPETMLEARLIARERSHLLQLELPKQLRFINRREKKYSYYSVTICMPQAVRKEIERYCERLRVHHCTFIRSITHKYLTGSWEPKEVYNQWLLSGKVYKITADTKIKTNMSYAAKQAITMRAEALRVYPETLLRTLILETMLGNFCSPGTYPYVARTQMFTDVQQYQTRFAQDSVSIPRRLDFGEPELPADLDASDE